jgi:hypothetical protein
MIDFGGTFIHKEAWEEGQNEIDFKVHEANNYACNCHKGGIKPHTTFRNNVISVWPTGSHSR